MTTATPSDYEILGAAHTGITVSSIPAALAFWQKTIGCTILKEDIVLDATTMLPKLIGVADAGVKMTLVTLPNGHVIELLEYTGPAERKVHHPRPCDVGSVHVSLYVKGLHALVAEIERLEGWELRGTVQRYDGMPGGDWLMVYLRGPDGEAVELIEIAG